MQGFAGVALAFAATVASAAEVEVAADSAGPSGDAALLGVELIYDAPAGCGDRYQVWRRAQQLLSGPRVAKETVRAAITVRVAEGGLKVNYEATREATQSRRDLVVTDCAAAVEASALLLMLTLDPGAAARVDDWETQGNPEPTLPSSAEATARSGSQPPVTQPAPKPALTPQPEGPVTPRPTASIVRPDPEGSSGRSMMGDTWAGVGSELVTGLAPNAGVGVRLDVGTTVAGVRLGCSGSYDWVSERVLSQASFASVQAQLYRLRLWVGPAWRTGIVQFGPLVSVGVEHLRAEVVGISNPSPGAMTWLSAGAGGHTDVHLMQSLAVRVQASAVFSLERRVFTVRGIPGLVHEPAALGVEAATGLVWTWDGR